MSFISKTKQFSKLTLVILAINLALISTNNFRFLDSHNKTYTYADTICSKVSISSTGSECLATSDLNTQCCIANLWGNSMCAGFPTNGTEAEELRSIGYGNFSEVQLVASSKITGNMELRCSNNNPFSEAIKAKVSLCGNISDSSNGNCAKLNDNDIQCCFIQTGMSAVGQLSNCFGFAAKMKMPSYAMKANGSVFKLSCGASDDEVKQMETCADVVPSSKEDCYKQSLGNIKCEYALMSKTTPVCIGTKEDLKLMKQMKVMQNLQNVEIIDASQTTVAIDNASHYLKSFIVGLVLVITMLI